MTGGATRRSVLSASLAASLAARLTAALSAAGLTAPLLATAGCGAPASATPAARTEPDVTILRAAIAAKENMIALYTAVRTSHPALAQRLDPLMGDNGAHLAELQRRLVEPAHQARQRAIRQRGEPPGTPPPVPSSRGAALAMLRSAERTAAAAHVRQLGTVAPSLAQLLASIAACEATHVVALTKHGLAP